MSCRCCLLLWLSNLQVVVYAWDMHALRAFINRRPLIGAGIQKAISEDLVNKVDQSRGHKKRYRLLLEQALEAGEINLVERKKLQRWEREGRVEVGEAPATAAVKHMGSCGRVGLAASREPAQRNRLTYSPSHTHVVRVFSG